MPKTDNNPMDSLLSLGAIDQLGHERIHVPCTIRVVPIRTIFLTSERKPCPFATRIVLSGVETAVMNIDLTHGVVAEMRQSRWLRRWAKYDRRD